MRIRKNANISSLMSSHASGAEPLQTHVCQLNQSPWDVIPFSQEAYPSPFLHHQFECEDSFNGNGSLGDSIGAVESAASMMEDKVDNIVINDNNFELGKKHLKKLWHSHNEAKITHHSHNNNNNNNEDIKSNNNSNSNSIITHSIKKPEKGSIVSSVGRRGRAKAAKKGSGASTSANPYEFYYYSGFGPLWGKRRGDNNSNRGEVNANSTDVKDVDEINNNASIIASVSPQNTSPSSIEDNNNETGEFDYVDEDDDEEEDDRGRKKMRKLVKARSLKSLM